MTASAWWRIALFFHELGSWASNRARIAFDKQMEKDRQRIRRKYAND